MKRPLKISITISAVLVCAYLLLSYYVQKTFRLQISFPELADKAKAIGSELDKTTAAVRSGGSPLRKSDLKSAGNPREELRLLGLREEFQVFEFEYRRAPRDASDFEILATNAALPAERRGAVLRYAQECKIITFPRDSYLLNCDGWRPQTGEAMNALLANFSDDAERFYLVGGHVFLYAPPGGNETR